MDKIKLNFFDAFAYLVPGSSFVLLTIYLLSEEVKGLQSISKVKLDVSSGQIIGLIICSYVLGIIINSIGHILYQYAKKIWSSYVVERVDNGLTDAEIHVLIREHAPANHAYLESWLGLSNMSHNLGVVLLYGALISLYKLVVNINYHWIEWSFVFIVFILSAIIFFKRSIRFNNYFKNDSSAAIQKLKLKDRNK